MSAEQHIDSLNSKAMHSTEAINTYANRNGLYPIEEIAFAFIKEEFKGHAILDLGVGGGRTTPFLKKISNNYTGVDYAKGMIDQCKRKHPDTKFIHADARNLSQFPDSSFDLIVFSNEGLCMVNHHDRQVIIKEAHRLLKAKGVFLFSSYNQDSPAHNSKFTLRPFQTTRHPIKFMVRSLRFFSENLKALKNRLSFKKLEIRLKEYSIINDTYHFYTTLLYYISITNQKAQLKKLGFSKQVQAITESGITEASSDKVIYFLCRKE